MSTFLLSYMKLKEKDLSKVTHFRERPPYTTLLIDSPKGRRLIKLCHR